MANTKTADFCGEVEFEARGEKLTLKLGNKAMRKIEIAIGKPMPIVGKMLSDPEQASVELMTTVFWGALQSHHPEMTRDDCDDIIDEIGQERAGGLITEAFEAAQQQKKAGADNPR